MEIRLLDPIKDEKILFDIVKLEDNIFKESSIGNCNIIPMARYGKVYAMLDDDNNILAACEIMASFDRDLAYIYGLFTNVNYQKMGLGTKMLEYILNELKNIGIKKVRLITELDNVANKLYQKFNFKIIDIVEDEFKDGKRRNLYEALLY